MSEVLKNKIDFSMVISVRNANPNGDPNDGNRPREDYDGYGQISDVCIKRKIRNRLQDMGQAILVQANDRRQDSHKSVQARINACEELKAVANGKKTNYDEYTKIACEKWADVRAFGQVFAFSGNESSIGVRGPVSIRQGLSVSPINIVDMGITKSTNGSSTITNKDPEGNTKAPDTMGEKHFVDFALYVIHGSINCQLAEKTGFTEEDAENIKEALLTLFENDASAARPEGSMEACRLYWHKHNGKTSKNTSAKVHRLLKVALKNEDERPTSVNDYDITMDTLEGLTTEEYNLMD